MFPSWKTKEIDAWLNLKLLQISKWNQSEMFYQLVPVANAADQNGLLHASQLLQGPTTQLFTPTPRPTGDIPSLLHTNFQPPRRPVQSRLPVKLRVGKTKRGFIQKKKWHPKKKLIHKAVVDSSDTDCNIDLYEDQTTETEDDDLFNIPIRTDNNVQEVDNTSVTDSESSQPDESSTTVDKKYKQAPGWKKRHIKWILHCHQPGLQGFLKKMKDGLYLNN